MRTKLRWLATVGILLLAVGAMAENREWSEYGGTIDDYTPASVSGPWHVAGTWILRVNNETGRATFSAALAMVRTDQGVLMNGKTKDLDSEADRNPHTHHITVVNGTVTQITGGFRVSGPATITGNGNFPAPFPVPDAGDSTLDISITGGNHVKYSNIKLTFGGAAEGHFGPDPVNGVVVVAAR